MKKLILIMAVIGLLNSWTAQSQEVGKQTASSVLSEFSKNKQLKTSISVGSFGMFFVKLVGGNKMPALKGAESMNILLLNDECSIEQKLEIKERFAGMEDDNFYSTVLRVKDGSDDIRIMANEEAGIIREVLIVILSDSDNDVVVTQLKGKFDPSELAELMEKVQKSGRKIQSKK